jgi:asparagine synthetase B (glutamine-hydrolysing)
MCGIADSFRARSTEQLQHMVARLTHRGPDETGLIDTSAGSLGHTRLAIVDVDSSHQPLQSRRTWISFNGEIYNELFLVRDPLGIKPLYIGMRGQTLSREQLAARWSYHLPNKEALYCYGILNTIGMSGFARDAA